MTHVAEVGTASTVDIFLGEIGRYPLLNANEEFELAKQHEQGEAARHELDQNPHVDASTRRRLEADITRGDQARQRLIQSNLRLVVSVAKQYQNSGVPFADLVQEGTFGLMEAIKRYDYRRGLRFATYGVWWIRQTIQQAIVNQARLISLPAGINRELYRLRKASAELETRLRHRATLQDLALEMGVPVSRIRQLIRWNQDILSLEAPLDDQGENKLADLIQDHDAMPMEEVVERRQLSECMRRAMATHLRPRDQEILSLRFGLNGDKGRTLTEVAQVFGITRQRVRQIEKRALKRLRRAGALFELAKTWIW